MRDFLHVKQWEVDTLDRSSSNFYFIQKPFDSVSFSYMEPGKDDVYKRI